MLEIKIAKSTHPNVPLVAEEVVILMDGKEVNYSKATITIEPRKLVSITVDMPVHELPKGMKKLKNDSSVYIKED